MDRNQDQGGSRNQDVDRNQVQDLDRNQDQGGSQGQIVDQVCAAAVRAMSGVHDAELRRGRLWRGHTPLALRAPHLWTDPARDDLRSLRGGADGVALLLRHSDPDLHRSLRPAEPVARLVFDLLEQLRVESLAAPWPGLRANLSHRHRQWSLALHHAGLTQSPQGLLLYTVVQVCRTRLTGEPVVEETEGLIESTRFALAPVIGTDLVGLRAKRADQSAGAPHALAIAKAVSALLATLGPNRRNAPSRSGAGRLPEALALFDSDQEDLDGHGGTEEGGTTGAEAPGSSEGRAREPYRVFTTAYDEERAAASLVRPALLAELRSRLDREVAAHGIAPGRVARLLQALFGSPVPAGWQGGHEEGVIDGRVLARLVTSPAERRVFRQESHEPEARLEVAILVDCSGSMKVHAPSVAVVADVLARAVELAGGSCEVLGFTTASWNGGRAQRDWIRAGRPTGPGRLNERRHLVFKDTATPWQRARPALAALLYEDLYREGVDGEALAWAASRLDHRSEGRRLLFVISDGRPMDSATVLANDPGYLDRHLLDVLAQLDRAGHVEVFGIGVGLDLHGAYPRSRVLDLSRGPRPATFSDILSLADPRTR